MSGGYRITDPSAIHFITFAVVEWVDVFTRKEYRDIVLDSIRYCQKEKGLVLYSWCLMSNHLHMVISAKGNNISDVLRDFKKYTSKQITNAIKTNPQESRRQWMIELFKKAGEQNSRNEVYQFWQQDNQPKELISQRFCDQKLDYIHNNPVEAGLVDKAEEYVYSSARDYYYGKKIGLLEIEWL